VQFPSLAGVVLAHAEGDMAGELVGVLRSPHAAQVIGAGDQQFLDLAEAAHNEAAVVVELGAYAQGDVDALVDDVHAPVADQQLHPHLRIPRQELGQQPGHVLLRHADGHADADHAARLGAEPIHDFMCGLGFGQHGLGVAVDAVAYVGHGEAARGALQQAHAQVGFELADATAQPRFRNAQRALGRGEPAVVDHHREVIEVVEVVHGIIPKSERLVTFDQLYPTKATT
jgi:hypothetical protein